MLKYILLLIITGFIFTCGRAGKGTTSTETETGSVYGNILNDDALYDETVIARLYKIDKETVGLSKTTSDSSPLFEKTITDGSYIFEELASGDYFIKIIQDSILIGEKTGISLKEGEEKEIHISITIIINQTINIVNNNQNITINNINVYNGTVSENDSGGYDLKFADADTQFVDITITENGKEKVETARLIKNPDGTYSTEMEKEDPAFTVSIDGREIPSSNVTINVDSLGTEDIDVTFEERDSL